MTLYWKKDGSVDRRLRFFQKKHPLFALQLETMVVKYRDTFHRYMDRWGQDEAENALATNMDSWWATIVSEHDAHRRTLREAISRRIDALWAMAVNRAREEGQEFLHASGHVILSEDSDRDLPTYDSVNSRVRVTFCVRKNGAGWSGECSLDFDLFSSGLVGGKTREHRLHVRRDEMSQMSISALDAIEATLVKCCTK